MQQEKLAAVGQLVSGVAHELNNPLASVMAFAQLLLAAPLDAPHDAFALDAINQEAKRAAKIVSNLLTFARQHQPERHDRRSQSASSTTRSSFAATRCASREIEVDTAARSRFAAHVGRSVPAAAGGAQPVTNAEQALSAREQGPAPHDRRPSAARSALVLRVSDNGPGIATEHLSRIFNPFFTTKPVGEGTGLGLSISDGIVREHGGRSRVESRVGEGATFVVGASRRHAARTVNSVVPAEGVAPTPPARRRLLVVDDEPALRTAISTFFRSLGHTVDVAANRARRRRARVATSTYDAMLLDLRLPDMTGDEVLARARSRTDCAPRRVVFVTGDTQSDVGATRIGRHRSTDRQQTVSSRRTCGGCPRGSRYVSAIFRPMADKIQEHDAMICRSCGNEERASEGYPCVDCGTFICVICDMRGITRCRSCQAKRDAAADVPGDRPRSLRRRSRVRDARRSTSRGSSIAVGHATDDAGATGLTVIRGTDYPLRAGVATFGRATGSRELLTASPDHLVDGRVDAIMLTGGSAYGLDACAGVMDWMEDYGRGFPVGPGVVPIVPAAVVFDLDAARPIRRASDARDGVQRVRRGVAVRDRRVGRRRRGRDGRQGARLRRSRMRSGFGCSTITSHDDDVTHRGDGGRQRVRRRARRARATSSPARATKTAPSPTPCA